MEGGTDLDLQVLEVPTAGGEGPAPVVGGASGAERCQAVMGLGDAASEAAAGPTERATGGQSAHAKDTEVGGRCETDISPLIYETDRSPLI